MKNYLRKYSSQWLSFAILFLLINTENIFAQTYSISGKVVDSRSKPIPGVNVILINSNFGAATTDDGNYEVANLPSGTYKIEFSAIGYEKFRKDKVIIENESIVLDVALIESVILTDEVLIIHRQVEVGVTMKGRRLLTARLSRPRAPRG